MAGFGKGARHTPEAIERIRRRREEQTERAKVRPRDLDQLRRSGTVSDALRPLLDAADTENAELLDAIGGDAASPQRRAILADVVRVGLILRGELARYLQSGEADAASRVGTLASTRRASLIAIGLDRVESGDVSLAEYIAQRQTSVSATSEPLSASARAGKDDRTVSADRATEV
jgi:hypothetical protein